MRKRAFTLMELLIVIAIIGILFALIMPTLGKAIASSKQVKCASNLRQLYAATTLFAQDREGVLVYNLNDPYNGWTWVEAVAPYLEKVAVSQGVRPGSILGCPAETKKTEAGAYSDYGKNMFVNGNLNDVNNAGLWTPPYYVNVRMVTFAQPSRTVIFADAAYRDLQIWLPDNGFSFRHNGNSNFLYADGHVESVLKKDIPGNTSDAIHKFPWSAVPTM